MNIKNGIATGVLAAVIGLGTNAVTSPSNTSKAAETGCTQSEQTTSTNGGTGGSSATATATSSSTSSSSGLLTVSNVANDVVDVNGNHVLNNNEVNVLSNNLNGNNITVKDVLDLGNVTTTVTDTVDVLSPLDL